MFTTGFKFFFGLGVALATGAVLYGYTSGGNHMGPLSMGWKGGVGDHVGYGVLLGLAFVAMGIALFLVVFRDADPAAQAHYMGVEEIASTPAVTRSFWPVVGAFGAGTMAIGLVLNTAVFIVGLCVVGAVAIEWMMDAWSDRATGDPEANRALRNRVMAPIEIPAAGAAAVAVAVLAVSRILLASSKNGAVLVAGVAAVVIFGVAILVTQRRQIPTNLVAGLTLTLGVAVLAGGIVATVTGEREFHPHEVHSDDGDHDESDDHEEDDHEEDDHSEEDSHDE